MSYSFFSIEHRFTLDLIEARIEYQFSFKLIEADIEHHFTLDFIQAECLLILILIFCGLTRICMQSSQMDEMLYFNIGLASNTVNFFLEMWKSGVGSSFANCGKA